MFKRKSSNSRDEAKKLIQLVQEKQAMKDLLRLIRKVQKDGIYHMEGAREDDRRAVSALCRKWSIRHDGSTKSVRHQIYRKLLPHLLQELDFGPMDNLNEHRCTDMRIADIRNYCIDLGGVWNDNDNITITSISRYLRRIAEPNQQATVAPGRLRIGTIRRFEKITPLRCQTPTYVERIQPSRYAAPPPPAMVRIGTSSTPRSVKSPMARRPRANCLYDYY